MLLRLLNLVVSDNITIGGWSYIIPLVTGQGISALVWDNIQRMIDDCKIPTEQQPRRRRRFSG